ncbi:Uncharacterized protein conserved in bacteria [Serratia fonticola]|uniref:Uncharacterized protein conserved in bacteria n=1 Tax=Serratia fonticola TaxID=47917 RepID=A0A4U9URQ4_SERFO|nr:Uncharacterized protein conserved in bacteria [Serratia fonticola]
MSVGEFEDLPQAISAIEQVISGEQPFRRALQTLSDNTRLPAVPDALQGKERQELLQKSDYQLLGRVNREFAPETGVLVENGDKGSVLQSVYQKLTELHRYLLAIQNSPAPGKAAMKAVQLRLDQKQQRPDLRSSAVGEKPAGTAEPLGRGFGRTSLARSDDGSHPIVGSRVERDGSEAVSHLPGWPLSVRS